MKNPKIDSYKTVSQFTIEPFKFLIFSSWHNSMTEFFRGLFKYENERKISRYNWLKTCEFTQMISCVLKRGVSGLTLSNIRCIWKKYFVEISDYIIIILGLHLLLTSDPSPPRCRWWPAVICLPLSLQRLTYIYNNLLSGPASRFNQRVKYDATNALSLLEFYPDITS